MVESVDDLKSSCSLKGIQMPNLEVLDAKIATESSMKPSLQERSDWRNEKPKKGPFPSWRTDLRVLPGHWSQRFCRELCRPIYKCSSKWRYSENWVEVGWNFIINDENSINNLEGLCKFRIRESEKLKTVLELYDLEMHQKKDGFDDHKLLTMVKRSIEQNKNFGARNGNYERNALVKNPGDKTAWYKEFLEIVGNGSPTGSAPKEIIVISVTMSMNVQKWHSRIRLRILSCGRMREMRREPEVPESQW